MKGESEGRTQGGASKEPAACVVAAWAALRRSRGPPAPPVRHGQGHTNLALHGAPGMERHSWQLTTRTASSPVDVAKFANAAATNAAARALKERAAAAAHGARTAPQGGASRDVPAHAASQETGAASAARNILAAVLQPSRRPPSETSQQRDAAQHPAKRSKGAREGVAPQQPFVPWRVWNAVGTDGEQRHSGGQQTHLMVQPVVPPPGWFPRVHGLAGEPQELHKRALEATRIVPMLSRYSVSRLLDTAWSDIESWPPGKALSMTLNAVCGTAGHGRLAAMRQHLFALGQTVQRNYGAPAISVMRTRVSATIVREHVQERHDAATQRREALEQRTAQAGPSARKRAKPASEEDVALDAHGAASAALSALEAASRSFFLEIVTEHP